MSDNNEELIPINGPYLSDEEMHRHQKELDRIYNEKIDSIKLSSAPYFFSSKEKQ